MKRIIATILAGSICLSLCACGGNRTVDTEGTVYQQETAAKTENSGAVKKEDEAKKEKELTPISIGDKITLDFAEITVDESGIKENIQQSITTGNITYTTGAQAVSGSKYVYMRGTLKNTSQSEISSVNIGGTVVLDGYTYNIESISIIEANGSSTWRIAPLTTYTYTVYAKVPNEIADNHQSCVLNLCFEENFESGFRKDISEYKYGYTLNIQ